MKTQARKSLEDPQGPGKPEEKRGPLQFLKELPGLVILAFALALITKTFLFQAFFIPSGSMEPTLTPGDRVLVNKIPYYFHDPRRGDIIVFEDPHPSAHDDRGVIGGFVHWLFQGIGVQRPEDEDFIKRVIGLPGDTVEGKNGSVFVNGTKIEESYLPEGEKTEEFDPFHVPAGMLFVMGDNRGNSSDSRFNLGYIPIDNVIGKAFVVMWPPSRAGLLH
ncbi:MAG TPA: signal peptidase I [Actinomycetota bacterium]|nr:signal peptidase I [Actinomycetota bacterium]